MRTDGNSPCANISYTLLRQSPRVSATSIGRSRILSIWAHSALSRSRWTEVHYPFTMPLQRTIEPLTDPDSLRLARPVSADRLAIPPNTEIKGARFRFQWWRDPTTRRLVPRMGTIPSDLLEAFVSATSDASLTHFAKCWGPLGLFEITAVRWEVDVEATGPSVAPHFEPIDAWRYFRRVMASLLTIAAALREGAPIERHALAPLEWKGALELSNIAAFDKWSPAQRRHLAMDALCHWTSRLVADCGLRPTLALGDRPDGFNLVFSDLRGDLSVFPYGMSLFGALTLQLLTAITGSGFATCSGCGALFVPRRRPAFGRRRYCKQCGQRAALRDAKADYRARKRDAMAKKRRTRKLVKDTR